MNSARWIEDCCLTAIVDCSKMGMEAAATNERTVAGWNILLRANREHFPMPNPKILHRQKHSLPDLLEYFAEEITTPWLGYCIENLADLTVEMARNHLITPLIPTAAATRRTSNTSSSNAVVTDYNEVLLPLEEDAGEEEVNCMPQTSIRDCLLPFYLETPISISTTWRWLKRLGFNHDARKNFFR